MFRYVFFTLWCFHRMGAPWWVLVKECWKLLFDHAFAREWVIDRSWLWEDPLEEAPKNQVMENEPWQPGER